MPCSGNHVAVDPVSRGKAGLSPRGQVDPVAVCPQSTQAASRDAILPHRGRHRPAWLPASVAVELNREVAHLHDPGRNPRWSRPGANKRLTATSAGGAPGRSALTFGGKG